MGRLPDEEGRARLTVQTGVSHRLEHSSGSDIEGVTIGRDLNALMPFELAQYSDAELEGVFLRKISHQPFAGIPLQVGNQQALTTAPL